jgi:hypothetical protein
MSPFLARTACFLLLLAGSMAVHAQPANDSDSTKYIRARSFNLAFTLPADDRERVQSLKLYVTSPGGRDWQLHATATPSQTRPAPGSNMLQGNFDVRLDREGSYDFAIMTVYRDGRSLPESVERLTAEQRVVIDTRPPDVGLRAAAPKQRTDGSVVVGIEWQITDEYLDPNSIRMEGRWVGGLPAWGDLSERAGVAAQGRKEWTLAPGRRMEVRLSALDRAGNRADKFLVLGAGVGQTTGSSTEPGGAPREGGAYDAQPGYKITNDKTLKLQFKVREATLSGIDTVELWATLRGNDWRKVDQQFSPPAEGSDVAEIEYTVPQDGTYGLTLVARSKAKIAQPAPSGNQPPQIWVVVDTKEPDIEQFIVKFAQANNPRTLVLTWKAKDEHLEAQPVIFQYLVLDKNGRALNKNGKGDEWIDLTPQLANTGRHVCATPQLPAGSYQFKVRMTVADRAGNVAESVFKDPVNIDVTPPHVEIIDVKPTKPQNKSDNPNQP